MARNFAQNVKGKKKKKKRWKLEIRVCHTLPHTLEELGEAWPKIRHTMKWYRKLSTARAAYKRCSIYSLQGFAMRLRHAASLCGFATRAPLLGIRNVFALPPPQQKGDIAFALCTGLRIVIVPHPFHQQGM